MEGDYLFQKWAKSKGFPSSLSDLHRQHPDYNQQEIDNLWEHICALYDERGVKDGVRRSKRSL